MSENNETIEFNSMVAVLKRLSKTTDELNNSRHEKKLDVMIDYIYDYYLEISSDLTTKEKQIREKIEKLFKIIPMTSKSNRAKLLELNRIDEELRSLAKKHGYLTKNAENKGKAIIN